MSKRGRPGAVPAAAAGRSRCPRPAQPPSSLPFGQQALPLVLPSGWRTSLPPAESAPLRPWDEQRLIGALHQAGLAGAARHAHAVTVLIPDGTRVARSDLYVPAVLAVLQDAGVAGASVRLLLACGTHVPLEDVGAARLLGTSAGSAALLRYDCRAPAELAPLGTTSSGNEVRVARHVSGADLVILTGRVTNHYFAGFTGGPKALLPGAAGYDTIRRNHRRVLDSEGRPDPRAGNGRLRDNPVHEEMREAERMLAGERFVVNTIVGTSGELLEVCAGESAAAHAQACAAAEARCRVDVEEPFDVVIAAAGGAPYDSSMMQALKTPNNWSPAVRPGGTLIWVAAFDARRTEGFRRWLSLTADEELHARAVREYDLYAHNSVLLRQLLRRHRIILVSRLERATVEALGLDWAPSLDAAVAAATARAGASAGCLVVPHGNETFAARPQPAT